MGEAERIKKRRENNRKERIRRRATITPTMRKALAELVNGPQHPQLGTSSALTGLVRRGMATKAGTWFRITDAGRAELAHVRAMASRQVGAS